MGLKLRIVIMNPDHTNDIFMLKKKKLVGKMFAKGDEEYLINDSHFQLTHSRPWYFLWLYKQYHTTYYYAKGSPNPLPVPLFNGARESTGTQSEELAALFNPWFYRTIAAPVRDVWQQIEFYVSVGTLIGVLYLCWQLYNGINVELPPSDPTGGGTTEPPVVVTG